MTILDHFQHINLTNDQRIALEKLHTFLEGNDRIFILQGYAGSGKTTLLKGVVEYLKSIEKKYQLMAPTGRAAKVINQKTGFESTTIHRGIYSFQNLEEIPNDDDSNVSFRYRFKIKTNPSIHDSVLLIDETSMLSDVYSQGEFFQFGSGHLLQDLIEYSQVQSNSATSKIIFIGDPAQLPPIGMNYSPGLSPEYMLTKYKLKTTLAEMKEVKRQDAENGILKTSFKIRQCLTSGFFNDFDLRENKIDILNPEFQDFLETYKSVHDQKIVICYKNKSAQDLNRVIRRDKFGEDMPIQPGDTVIIGSNNYRIGLMNGEFAIVSESASSVESREITFYEKGGKTKTVRLVWRSLSLVIPDENNQPKTISGQILENYLYGDNYLTPDEHKALFIDFKNRYPKLKKDSEEFKEAILNDKYYNCILLKYGYAVTCHKAQGGEWSSAFVFWDRGTKGSFNFYEDEQNEKGKTNSDFYRWAYTAVTRASKTLYCINPPYFSSFSGMHFIDISVQKAFNQLTGQSGANSEIDIDEIFPELERFGLKDAPLQIQDHFIQRWYCLQKQYVDIVSWQKVLYEIRYTFSRDGKTAGIIYWINVKNNFNAKFQKIPALTNSDELYEEVIKLISEAPAIKVNRATAEAILTQVEFDINLEEQKPFLRNLYELLLSELPAESHIVDIQHLEWRERYTIENAGLTSVIDFEYNGSGFFVRVLPLEHKCESEEVIQSIKTIVKNLNQSDYVV